LKKITVLKRYLFILIAILACQSLKAQHEPDSLLYLRFPNVPPFKLYTVPDSTVFTKDNLQKKKATIIIVFSPDCEHCQAETKNITANIQLFKKTQIIMASPLDFDYIKKFYDEYNIAKYPVITMGRDPSYFLGTFYKIRSYPAIFIYDKKGKLVNWFNGTTPIEKILESLK
jgi:thioredoxin-related protein